MHVQVPTNVVRNDEIYIDNGSFLLYARLCLLHFRNYNDDEIKVDHKKLMNNLNISDTRTFKKRLSVLYKEGLILNNPTAMPRKGEMVILFNSKIIKDSKHFTKMDVSIFDYIDKINEHSFRLVFYYKSHINKKNKIDYCFVGFETLKVKLKMGNSTIPEANKLLEENKLIKITKHKLEDTGTYDDADELIFDRYNNHYTVNEKLF